jgi:hypothetical protein
MCKYITLKITGWDHPDDGGSKHLFGKLLPDYTAQHPRRQSSSKDFCFSMVYPIF